MNGNYVLTKNLIDKIKPTFKGTTTGYKRYLLKNPHKNFHLSAYEDIITPTRDYVSKVKEYLKDNKNSELTQKLLKGNEPTKKERLENIEEILQNKLDIMEPRGTGIKKRKVNIYKDPRRTIQRNNESHKKLLKQLNDLLKPDLADYKKAKGVYARGMNRGAGVYAQGAASSMHGAGFFSSIGGIFKNIIGKVVNFGKNLFTKPGALQKAVNTGIEVFKTGKDLVQNIKDKQGINALSNIGKLASNASNIRDIIKDNSKPQEMPKMQDKMARTEDGMGIRRRRGGNALTTPIHIKTKNSGYGMHSYV